MSAHPSLPSSGKAWNDQFGDSDQIPADNISFSEGCEHYFEKIRPSEVQCRNCYWGFYIDPRHDSVTEDGHVRQGDKQII